MLIDTLNKILMMFIVLSGLNIVRHTFFLIGSFIKSDDETPRKFILTKRELFLLGLSIAYILTAIITGVKI